MAILKPLLMHLAIRPKSYILFSCSTQLSMKFIHLINVSQDKYNIWEFWGRKKKIPHISLYEQLKFNAQLRWAWKKFDNLMPGEDLSFVEYLMFESITIYYFKYFLSFFLNLLAPSIWNIMPGSVKRKKNKCLNKDQNFIELYCKKQIPSGYNTRITIKFGKWFHSLTIVINWQNYETRGAWRPDSRGSF